MSQSFFRWWIDGLTAPLPRALRNWLNPPERLLLVALTGDRIRVHDPSSGAAADEVSLEDPAGRAVVARRLQRSRSRGVRTALHVPADAGLIREVTVNAARPGELRDFFLERIEEFTPFTQGQVYFACRLLEPATGTDRLRARLMVVPRATVEEKIAALGDAGLTIDTAVMQGEENPESALIPGSGTQRISAANLVLPVVAATLAALAAYLPLADKRDQLQDLENRAAQLRAEITAPGRPTEHDRATRLMNIAIAKAGDPPAVSVLADLSRTIPDHTWLRQVTVTPGSVTMQGETRDTADLVAQLESAPRFENARFEAALTRDTRSDYERFKLIVEVLDR